MNNIDENEKVKEISVKINSAVKEHDNIKANVYKLIKVEYVNALHTEGFILDDTSSVKILMKMASQRKDSIEQYIKGNRTDLAEREKAELEIINDMLPKLPSVEDIENYTKDVILKYKDTKDASYNLSMKDMKPIMTKVQSKYPTANGQIISKVLRTFINK